MIAYYSFNDGTAKDSSGFGNDGTIGTSPANPTYLTSGCNSGGCFSFDGIDDIIEIPPTSTLLASQSFSI